MDQIFPFLEPKESGPQFLEIKATTITKKTQQKRMYDVPWISIPSPPIVLEDVWWWMFPPLSSPQTYHVFYFFGRRAVLLAFPSFILLVRPTVLTGHSSPSTPSGRGATTQEFFGRRDTTFVCCVGGAGAASLDSLFKNHPGQTKDKSKVFLLLF